MKTLLISRYFIGLCFILASLSAIGAETNDLNTYSESKLNIAVTPNQPQFTIRLKSNPTTGYSWFLREYDRHLLSPVKHRFEVPRTKIIGAPGVEVWVFRVKPDAFVVPHQTRIRFVYARPWQGEESSSQVVFQVTTGSR